MTKYKIVDLKPDGPIVTDSDYEYVEGPMMCGHCDRPIKDHKEGDDCPIIDLLMQPYFRPK